MSTRENQNHTRWQSSENKSLSTAYIHSWASSMYNWLPCGATCWMFLSKSGKWHWSACTASKKCWKVQLKLTLLHALQQEAEIQKLRASLSFSFIVVLQLAHMWLDLCSWRLANVCDCVRNTGVNIDDDYDWWTVNENGDYHRESSVVYRRLYVDSVFDCNVLSIKCTCL